MEIIQSFYYGQNNERQREIEYALDVNLKNKFINKIHLFITEKDYIKFITSEYMIKHTNKEKIKLNKLEHQPTYPELFTYGSKLNDCIIAICNSDIEFIIENNNIFERLINKNIGYFITRHEYNGDPFLINNFGGSHDAFIFHSNTLKLNIENKDLKFIDYIQNTSGIEAILTIYFIEQLNYKLLNPCFQIKLIHHHKSNIRLWSVQGKHPVGYTSPKPNGSIGIHNKYMINPCKL